MRQRITVVHDDHVHSIEIGCPNVATKPGFEYRIWFKGLKPGEAYAPTPSMWFGPFPTEEAAMAHSGYHFAPQTVRPSDVAPPPPATPKPHFASKDLYKAWTSFGQEIEQRALPCPSITGYQRSHAELERWAAACEILYMIAGHFTEEGVCEDHKALLENLLDLVIAHNDHAA